MRRAFLISQVTFLLGLGVVLVVGDHTRITADLMRSTVAVNQPIILTFNLPLKQSSVHVSLIHNGNSIPGSVSWSSNSLAFLPAYNLSYATSYHLDVTSASDTEGHTLAAPLTFNLTTDPARFLYLTPDGYLKRYDVNAHVSTRLTPTADFVTGYAGDQLFAYHLRATPHVNGLAFLPGTATAVLYQGTSLFYTLPRICNSDQDAVLYENYTDANHVPAARLVTFPSGEYSRRQTLVDGEIWAGSTDLACSAMGNQVVYRDPPGDTYLSNLQQPDPTLLGTYQAIDGFTPQGDQLLLSQDQGGAGGLFDRLIVSVAANGVASYIGDTTVDSQDAAYDPAEQILAASIDTDWQDESGQFNISLYKKQQGALENYQLPVADGFTDDHPEWALDGGSFTYEHLSTTYAPNRAQDAFGNLLDAELYLATVPTSAHLFTANITTTDLGVKGSQVTWLP